MTNTNNNGIKLTKKSPKNKPIITPKEIVDNLNKLACHQVNLKDLNIFIYQSSQQILTKSIFLIN